MAYPSELLPKEKYTGQIHTNDLLTQHPQVWLLRKSSPNADVKRLAYRDVFRGKDGGNQFFGLSISVFGPFKKEHIAYLTKPQPWKEGDVCLESHQVEYSAEDPTVFPIYLALEDCHDKTLPMTKQNDKGHNVETVETNIKVEHKPMNHNYWHFEFIVREKNGTEITKDAPKWYKRSAESFAEEFLMSQIETLDQQETILNELLYTKAS